MVWAAAWAAKVVVVAAAHSAEAQVGVKIMADIPATIPFLEAAYAQRPNQPDTGGQSFFRAFELAQRAQQLRQQQQDFQLRAAESAIRQKTAQQDFQMNALKLKDMIEARDEKVLAGQHLTAFASVIRRAKIAGASDPTSVGWVTDYLAANPGTLSNPTGLALWNEFKQTSDEEARALREVNDIRERGLAQVAVQQATGERQLTLEDVRARNRANLATELEQVRRQTRLDVAGLAGSRHISREEFVNRHFNIIFNALQRQSFLMNEKKSADQLRSDAHDVLTEEYDKLNVGGGLGATAPLPLTPATPAARIKVRRKSDGATGNLLESDFDPALYDRLP